MVTQQAGAVGFASLLTGQAIRAPQPYWQANLRGTALPAGWFEAATAADYRVQKIA